VRIDGELMEIWLNEVCDKLDQSHNNFLSWLESDNVAMGLIHGAMKFSQWKHVTNVLISREI